MSGRKHRPSSEMKLARHKLLPNPYRLNLNILTKQRPSTRIPLQRTHKQTWTKWVRASLSLITLHGTLDALLPITKSSDKYRKLIEEKGRSDIHYYYRIEGGSHVDGLYDYTGPDPKNPDLALRKEFREKLRPMLPCYKAAFDRLVEWVEQGATPPKNQTVPKSEEDVVNSCSELEKQK